MSIYYVAKGVLYIPGGGVTLVLTQLAAAFTASELNAGEPTESSSDGANVRRPSSICKLRTKSFFFSPSKELIAQLKEKGNRAIVNFFNNVQIH